MERLTERDEFGNADIIGVDSEDLQLNLDFEQMNKVTDSLNKLAEYEDLEGLIGIPLKDLAEIFRQNIPEDCKHPHKAIVLTDDDVDRWEKYKDFATVFRKKMTETVCEFLSDKEEFGKWLDRNIWIAKKCDEYARVEEQGLLFRLPCKVGTKVWTIMCGINGMHPTIFKRDFELSMVEYFGISVFLTREEAEHKLKEMEGDNNV